MRAILGPITTAFYPITLALTELHRLIEKNSLYERCNKSLSYIAMIRTCTDSFRPVSLRPLRCRMSCLCFGRSRAYRRVPMPTLTGRTMRLEVFSKDRLPVIRLLSLPFEYFFSDSGSPELCEFRFGLLAALGAGFPRVCNISES